MLSKQFQLRIKHTFDRIAAFAALVMLAPAFFAIAALIALDSGRPILFVQARVGYLGRRFNVFKFRTMVQNADALLERQHAGKTDRITRVGKWLRLTSLDELPQLINILLGQMSFVGPRPGTEERHQRFSPSQKRRCEMKPGITGLAQVSGRNTLPWSRRTELDVQYIDSYSWRLDLEILWNTVRVVINGDGFVPDRNPDQVDDIPHASRSASASATNFNHRGVFQRVEPSLVGNYAKSSGFEIFLHHFNQSLAASHDAELRDLPETFSTIHVIGAPRSGTTLLTQLVSASLDVGYINNLIAAFWRVPCYGIQLSQKLLAGMRPDCFASDHGRTAAIHEPHEFGYFWSHALGYREMAEQDAEFGQTIDWQRLRILLLNMAHTFDRPVLFKSFLLAWHLEQMSRVLPKSIFLWIRRERVANALSICGAREAQLGALNHWVSMKPKEYEWLQHEPVPVQVAGQVFFTEAAIARQAERMGGQNVVELGYHDLCTRPQEILDRIHTALQANGQEVRQVTAPPTGFDARTRQSGSTSLTKEIEAAFEWFDTGEWQDRMGFRQAG